ncbi:porin [Vibrio hannami]|uniref:porin n=1 Tax=Vibrio hannami TaxID=2717094 RepID=UPI00240FC7B7|nr:porin [Vibrio hannami]MDG3088931.1 porin [Vibrio hannami]
MNKKIIALAVAAASASSIATAAEVYNQDGTRLDIGGRAEFRGDFVGKDDGTELEGSMNNKSRFRLNVGGETQVTDNLTGFGFYEGEQGVNSSSSNDANDSFKQRYAFAGLKGDFGALSFGRQDTAAVQISQMSDVTTFTGAQKTFIDAGDEQINNTILYTADIDDLTLKASYIAGSEKDTDGYGLSAIYTLPMGLGFGLGYSEDGKATNGTDGTKGKAVIAGLNYTMDALYLGATYTQGDTGVNDGDEFNGMEFAAVYSFDNNFALKGAYQKTEIDPTAGSKYNASDFFELTGEYNFNSNLNAYVSYMFNNLDQKDMNMIITDGYSKDADDTLRLGLKYSF